VRVVEEDIEVSPKSHGGTFGVPALELSLDVVALLHPLGDDRSPAIGHDCHALGELVQSREALLFHLVHPGRHGLVESIAVLAVDGYHMGDGVSTTRLLPRGPLDLVLLAPVLGEGVDGALGDAAGHTLPVSAHESTGFPLEVGEVGKLGRVGRHPLVAHSHDVVGVGPLFLTSSTQSSRSGVLTLGHRLLDDLPLQHGSTQQGEGIGDASLADVSRLPAADAVDSGDVLVQLGAPLGGQLVDFTTNPFGTSVGVGDVGGAPVFDFLHIFGIGNQSQLEEAEVFEEEAADPLAFCIGAVHGLFEESHVLGLLNELGIVAQEVTHGDATRTTIATKPLDHVEVVFVGGLGVGDDRQHQLLDHVGFGIGSSSFAQVSTGIVATDIVLNDVELRRLVERVHVHGVHEVVIDRMFHEFGIAQLSLQEVGTPAVAHVGVLGQHEGEFVVGATDGASYASARGVEAPLENAVHGLKLGGVGRRMGLAIENPQPVQL